MLLIVLLCKIPHMLHKYNTVEVGQVFGGGGGGKRRVL